MEIYLFVRALHIVCGALWLGAVVFMSVFLMPAIQEAGPDGAKVMAGLARRRFLDVIPMIATLSVVTGVWLYWRYTGGFDQAVSTSHTGLAFGIGGLIGILSLVIGVGVLRRSIKRAMALFGQAASLPEGTERAALFAEAKRLRLRAGTAGRIVAILLTIVAILMSIALYV